MELSKIKRVYFIGIGGIGMSAVARYFNERKVRVEGYDRSSSELTHTLEKEGIAIHYEEDIRRLDPLADLVVYTPAIPAQNKELQYYRSAGIEMAKRSEVLQEITKDLYCITVAGTHGKTTISTLIAHILHHSGYGCSAFLGGISVNYHTNFWSGTNNVAVIEADEYDRSFLKLRPDIAVLTAMDPDHLDIYGTTEAMQEAFISYTRNIKPDGALIARLGLERDRDLTAPHKIYYSLLKDTADIHAANIRMSDGAYRFDIVQKDRVMDDVLLNAGGLHNVENTVAAIAAVRRLGVSDEKTKAAIASFKGVKRRFEYIVKNERSVYIDDYAHHPEELRTLIRSAKTMFAGKACTVIFQPHLYSRTRDLADGFAESLDEADNVILLPIYPARELPMTGVDSQLISGKMKNRSVRLMEPQETLNWVKDHKIPLLITAGAGDIDRLAEPLKKIFSQK